MGEKEASLKSERKKCYEARDQYTSCVEKFLNQGKTETEAARSCRNERKGFDNNCPASWVNHFIRKYQFERYKDQLSKQGLREMSPKYSSIQNEDFNPSFANYRLLIDEVLRCNAYLNDTVFKNCIKLLEDESETSKNDAMIMTKMKFTAVSYHNLKDEKKKIILKEMARKLEGMASRNCKAPIFRKETELFASAMKPSADDNPSSIPNFENCLNLNDLIQCFFHRELEAENWQKLRLLILNYSSVDAYEYTDDILKVAENRKIDKFDVFELFMKVAERNNQYFIDEEDFNKHFKKVFRFCGFEVKKLKENDPIITKQEKTFVSSADLKKLIDTMDRIVRKGNQGVIKTKEVEQSVEYVKRWKLKKNIENGKDLVVVDALNFGRGSDPSDWKQVNKGYKHVFFSSRTPPQTVYKKVVDRYKGSAIFCDKVSADDLIVLRIAWEFGPEAVVVTNDLYRDHKKHLCGKDEELMRIWDDWIVDALYRHDSRKIESHRQYNLRLHQLDDSWIIPVVRNSPRMRKFDVYHVYPQNSSNKL